MSSFLPYMTNDYSTGLFSAESDDIYHSAFGAVTEAYEKFILPLNLVQLFENESEINVLDLCFGIGYNTKAFLSEFINYKKNNFKNSHKIKIDCVDTNETLIKLSPFISSKIDFFKRVFFRTELYKNITSYSSANKIINKDNFVSKYKIDPLANIIIIKNLIDDSLLNNFDELFNKFIKNNKNRIFFDANMLNLAKYLIKKRVYCIQKQNKLTCLHNIYYKNISKQYKLFKKLYSNNNIKLDFIVDDARNVLKSNTSKYNIIMLDGFTPAKCPCIWTEDFIKQLFYCLSDDGVLVTYNMSAPIRKALLNSGFYIGNIVNENNFEVGTIASKQKEYIKYKLSAKQQGLLNTKAGITYKDSNLNLDNDTILKNRDNELKYSNLESSSKFLKRVKNEI